MNVIRTGLNQKHLQNDATSSTWRILFISPELSGEAPVPGKGFLEDEGDWPDHGGLWVGTVYSLGVCTVSSLNCRLQLILIIWGVHYLWIGLLIGIYLLSPTQHTLLLWSFVDMCRTVKNLRWPTHMHVPSWVAFFDSALIL